MNTSRFFFPFGLLLCYGLFVAAAKGPFVPETTVPDCDPVTTEVTTVDYLPTTPLAFLPVATQPAFALPELRVFVRDTTPPAGEISQLEAQLARLKATEERLIARERQLAATQARLEEEASKMEAEQKRMQSEQQKLESEAQKIMSKANSKSRIISRSSSTTTTKTENGRHTDVTTSSAGTDLSSYGQSQIADQYAKQSCQSKETSLSLTTDKITCLRDKLTKMLVEDGLLPNREASAKLILNPDNTLINGRQLPGRLYAKYNKLFNDHCVKAKENRVIQIEGKNISVGDMMSSRGIEGPYLVGTSYSESK